ncbi:MAG TPA: FAD-dependent oxidoreductase [Gemmatimonadaceae bacterium]|nr:FAD-dependent oxidoreductase [Gemmatimonadaceae bacterium]
MIKCAALRASMLSASLCCAVQLRAQPSATVGSPAQSFDVVVYGGTAGGVIAAVSAARMGLSVALVEPSHHLGGMTTGGLSATDHGTLIVIGGYALEVYQRIGRKYGLPLWWYPEPRVAEEVLNDMITDAKTVRVFLGQRLRERQGVLKKGTVIQEIATTKGNRLRAKLFLDSSYEGDLMAQAGVTYTIGRESVTKYGESLAGVRPKDRNHQFDARLASRDQRGRLLPEISLRPRGEIGSGDARVQAYNFRLILTNNRKNQTPFTRPASYDPHRYEVLRRFIETVQRERGAPPALGDLFLIRDDLPWFKADFNNRGPFSSDYIGHSYGYADGSYAQRANIWRDHVSYTKGLLFFIANDPHVPRVLRDEMNKWGLARDEFVDSGNWPYQLYIREGRRMVGDFVMTQRDIQTDVTKHDAIAMGSYNSDSHNVQRFEQPDRSVQNEGNMEVPVEPYQIPYRVMLPSRTQATNLLVPVCLSASHVTYSTLRMEPQYMMIGQAAGVAAALAISADVPPQDIDITALRRILKAEGMVDQYDSTSAPSVPRFSPIN